MKKILTFITSACLTASMLPFSASAEEYEKYPNIADFSSYDEFCKELSDGIRDGRYFADFDGNGKFDLIDTDLILYHHAMIATNNIPIDWEGKNGYYSVPQNVRYSFLKGYDTVERDGGLYYFYPLNNDMLENVKKYGDVNGDGRIDTEDASMLLRAYRYNFELGDVDWDGSIDASDASYVLEFYSQCLTSSDISDNDIRDMIDLADMNGDSIVDALDASLILKAYAETSISE